MNDWAGTHGVPGHESLAARFSAFGWDVHDVNGHDEEEMIRAISDLETHAGKPHMLVARTTFGKGVSFMERQIKWHYWPMSEEEYQQAIHEIETKI